MSALYLVAFLAASDDRDSVHSLRATLKYAARRGLRAISARELPASNYQTIRRHDARRQIVTITQRRSEDTTMTSLKRFGPASRWIKLEDLHGKPPLVEQIGCVQPENGKFGERLVLTFAPSGRMVSLNKTSVGNLLRDFGEDDSSWLNQFVEVYAGTVETKDGTADAVLVRAADMPADAAGAVKPARTTKAKPPKASGGGANDMDDTIPF